MFAIVEHVTREIARHRRQHASSGAQPSMFGGRTVLLIDEAWHLVAPAETGTYANDLARRARHLGLFFIVMSQHLSDFETEHGLALLRNSTMQLLFAQHADEVPFVQDALRLSDQEAELIARLRPSRGRTRRRCGSTASGAARRCHCRSALSSTGCTRATRCAMPLPARRRLTVTAATCGPRSTSWRPLRTGASNEFAMSAVGALDYRRSRVDIAVRVRGAPGGARQHPQRMLKRITGAGGKRGVVGHGVRAAVGRDPGRWGDRHRDRPDRRAADARGRGRPERDPAAQLRARAAEPVRHLGRLLRGGHGRSDHGPARRHLRLARARRPGHVGEQAGHRHAGGRPGSRQRARAGAGPGAASAGQPVRVGGRLPEPSRARDGDRARAGRHGGRLHGERTDRRARGWHSCHRLPA